MAEEIIKVQIRGRETIKPSSPTPKHLRIIKLSWLDQISPDMYVPIILFYPYITTHPPTPQNPTEIASERLELLKETLSKALALYYPFAGRLRDNFSIECNDEGVEFIEAEAEFPISEVLRNPDRVGVLKSFLGSNPDSRLDSRGGSLLVAQATIFACGGISLALNFSHKLADACTIGAFVNTWAKTSRCGNPSRKLDRSKPEFGRACDLFPPTPPKLSSAKTSSMELVTEECVTKRYVFTGEKIASLKSKLKNKPTRVEAVSSLLWKCATKGSSSSKDSAWCFSMNLRNRISPPLGNNVAGNIVSGFAAKTSHREQEEPNLQVLADEIRRRVKEASERYSDRKHVFENVKGFLEEVQSGMKRNETEFFTCTSWCWFGLYEADFGWEKPTWVGLVSLGCKNCIVLMDTRDGDGIEAWLVFKEEDMAVIETDPELLDFASVNPSLL